MNVWRPLMSPRNVASWYPNAIELTALLLQQTEDINRAGRVTLDIVERGSDHIARQVVHNHRPEGAFDPYLRALQITPFGLALPYHHPQSWRTQCPPAQGGRNSQDRGSACHAA